MIAPLLFALLQGAAPAAPSGVTWTVEPESVTVAEPFSVTVRVRAARDANVVFPPGPDSTQQVEAVDPPTIAIGEGAAGPPERRATYRLIAWETGRLAVPIAPVMVGSGADAQRLEVHPQIQVLSVLPADSAKRVPRPALGVLETAGARWPWAVAAALALAALYVMRRRRQRRRAARPPPPPLVAALDKLARVDALGLLEAGEPSRYVTLHADALRGYLSARVPVASRALTSGEILAALRGRALPLDRVAALLAEADFVSFARRGANATRAKEYAKEVRAVLASSEEAFARDVPLPPAAPAKRAAKKAPERVA